MNLREPKSSTRKLLQLINTFRKLSGYKISMQKNQWPFHIPIANTPRKKIREAVSLTTILKTDQHKTLGLRLLCGKSLDTKPGPTEWKELSSNLYLHFIHVRHVLTSTHIDKMLFPKNFRINLAKEVENSYN